MAVHQPSLPGLSFISLAFPAVPAGLFSAAPDGALSSLRSGYAYIKLLSLYSPLVQNVFPPSLKSCPDTQPHITTLFNPVTLEQLQAAFQTHLACAASWSYEWCL